jgi:hypothetical protein
VDPLGQSGAGERLADRVVADIGDLAETIEQAESLKNSSINTVLTLVSPASTHCRVEREVKAR